MSATVVSLASRRIATAGGMSDLAKQDAVARLRRRIAPGVIIYAVLRHHSAANDWIICDFYLIDGHNVACLTEDVARAVERFDPSREVGVRLVRSPGRNVLRDVIDVGLSKLLFGVPDAIRHQVIL
jgi:hypothetical protein